MEFELRTHCSAHEPVKWKEWLCGDYQIVTHRTNEFYAYYTGSPAGIKYVCEPPHEVPCQGCRSFLCPGFHKAWEDLEEAKHDCLVHSAALPW